MARQKAGGSTGERGPDAGCGPPSPLPRLTQQGDAEQRQEHQGAGRGPAGEEHGLQPQEAPQEQPVQPGARSATEEDAGAGTQLSGVPTSPPTRRGTPEPGPPPHRPPAPAPPAPALPPAICTRPDTGGRGPGPAPPPRALRHEYSSPRLAVHQPRGPQPPGRGARRRAPQTLPGAASPQRSRLARRRPSGSAPWRGAALPAGHSAPWRRRAEEAGSGRPRGLPTQPRGPAGAPGAAGRARVPRRLLAACLPACLLAQPARWLSCGAVSQPPALGTSRGRGPEAVAWQGRGCRAGSRAEPCLDCHRLQGRRNRALPPLLLRKELDKGEPLLLGTPEAEGRSLWAAGIARLSQGMWERRSRAEPGTFGSFWGGQ